MAANRWSKCPRCIAKTPLDKNVDELTLREEFDIGINADGEFHVAYWAECDVCKFRFQHGHQYAIDINY